MKNRQYWVVYIVALVGVILSALAFNELNHHERNNQIADFKFASTNRIDAIEKNIEFNLESVRNIKAFYESRSEIDHESFRKFVTPVLKRNLAIHALEWIPKVTLAEREDYESAARSEGHTNFQFRELSADRKMVRANERAAYYPVYFVEPYSGNEAALGFDLGSNPSRMEALELARDTGKLTSSERITLVQTGQPGILFFNPIYNGDATHFDMEQRRQNLRGYALGVIQVDEMINNAFSSNNTKQFAGIDFYLYDQTQKDGPVLIYTHNSRARGINSAPVLSRAEALSGVYQTMDISVGGRDWLIVSKPMNEDSFTKTHWQAWSALLTGFVVTAFLCMLLTMSINRHSKVDALVESKTKELNDTKNRVSAIVENTADGIITIDQKGIIETVNPAAEDIFGYYAPEMIGNNIKMLLPHKEREQHDAYLASSTLYSSRIINQSRDLEGCRKNGSLFPMSLNVSFMEHEGERKYIGIIRDITERKQAENMKSEFVSTVSHELRTPLTSIKGALGLIRGSSVGDLPVKMRDMLNIAYNNSDRLVRLINDILDIEKIEAGKMEYDMKPIVMDELLKQAISHNEAFADVHHAVFTLIRSVSNIMVMGDSDRLMQVITNLLSNAAKFSPEGSEVVVSMEQIDASVCVKITDHGSGIPEEFRHRIFAKFSQADPSDTRQKGGTGLGLSISKAIIESHNGTIDFESIAGHETVFYFNLPILNPAQALDDTHPADDNLKILICEDEPDIATLLRLILNKEGFRTDVAYSAAQAEDLLAKNTYNAMTLDIALPDKDGISLLKDIRSRPETQSLPVIVISAKKQPKSDTLNGDAINILDWLEKPIDQERLVSGLRQVIWQSHTSEPSILHVEDDPDVITIVSALIDGLASVTPAASFDQAKTLLTENTYDLVILDLMLPGGKGEDLLPFLNRHNNTTTPVIIFSAKEVSHDTANSVHAALVKSQTSNDELATTIRSVIDTLRPRLDA